MADFRNIVTPGQSIGLSNNNPTNLKWSGSYWKGQVGQDQYGHAIFSDTIYGIRAAALQVLIDINVHGYNTLNTLIPYWTSDGDNYAQDIATALGISPDDILNLDNNSLPVLLLIMAKNEIGANYALMIDPGDWQAGVSGFSTTLVNASQSVGGYGGLLFVLTLLLLDYSLRDQK